MGQHRLTSALAAVISLVLLAAGCGVRERVSETISSLAGPGDAGVAQPVPSPAAAESLALLATILVKGRAPRTGYERELFGQGWTDDNDTEAGHNGCDTRNDILRRDLVDLAIRDGTRGCVVTAGVLHDPYTGTQIAFLRGRDTSDDVQIDHVVALSDAWQKGAQQLPPAARVNLANDPRNLQATDGQTNQNKGDADAATWLPPNNAYRCSYIARQISVKAAYALWVTAAERDAMIAVLSRC